MGVSLQNQVWGWKLLPKGFVFMLESMTEDSYFHKTYLWFCRSVRSKKALLTGFLQCIDNWNILCSILWAHWKYFLWNVAFFSWLIKYPFSCLKMKKKIIHFKLKTNNFHSKHIFIYLGGRKTMVSYSALSYTWWKWSIKNKHNINLLIRTF